MIVIGIIGAAGSGKSTAAKYLINRCGFTRKPLAGPLKNMLKAMGLSEDQVDGHLKEVPCELLCGKTPRLAMKTLGTEWRDMIGTNLWSNIIDSEIRAEPGSYVLDDVRFAHEVQIIRDLGGEIWRVRRTSVEPDVDLETLHESERHWRTLEYDREFRNDDGIDDLARLIERAITVLKEEAA